MYAVIRKYKFDPKSEEEINRKVRDGFVPLIRQTPGFVAYYWLATGAGEGASLSVFENKAGAEESIALAAGFVKNELASLFVAKPEIVQGEVQATA